MPKLTQNTIIVSSGLNGMSLPSLSELVKSETISLRGCFGDEVLHGIDKFIECDQAIVVVVSSVHDLLNDVVDFGEVCQVTNRNSKLISRDNFVVVSVVDVEDLFENLFTTFLAEAHHELEELMLFIFCEVRILACHLLENTAASMRQP
mmetsp:Transcript_7747/g.14708  ORF Transcript_7747/g.14708 Transcript_7747/m.14708 type:complete len:149 (-) Transcript_7747:4206-4652(-)